MHSFPSRKRAFIVGYKLFRMNVRSDVLSGGYEEFYLLESAVC
jgi:hypothetical protein